jgi:hypothetical protein
MARLSDALITRALRHQLETADETGWLRGLRDPHIAKALPRSTPTWPMPGRCR